MKKMNEFLSNKQAAEILGVNPMTLSRWVTKGKLTVYKNPINGRRLFDKEDVEALLKLLQPVRTIFGKDKFKGSSLSSETLLSEAKQK